MPTKTHRPPATRFVLISRWRMQCAAQPVWELLTDLEAWPQWWPQVRQARVLHRAPVGHTGTRVALSWRSALGYGFTIDVTNTRRERQGDEHFEIEGRSSGDMAGQGLWVVDLVPAAPETSQTKPAVDVTYRFELELTRPWMRRLAPLLRALFAWNHFAVMRAGAQGMARQLNCSCSELSNWTAGRR